MAARIGLALMPYFPLPQEWYRRILAADSEKRYASGRWDYLADVSEAHRYSLIIGCAECYKGLERAAHLAGHPEGRHGRADQERAVQRARLRVGGAGVRERPVEAAQRLVTRGRSRWRAARPRPGVPRVTDPAPGCCHRPAIPPHKETT